MCHRYGGASYFLSDVLFGQFFSALAPPSFGQRVARAGMAGASASGVQGGNSASAGGGIHRGGGLGVLQVGGKVPHVLIISM
jgi:hypothetical protein